MDMDNEGTDYGIGSGWVKGHSEKKWDNCNSIKIKLKINMGNKEWDFNKWDCDMIYI